MKKALIPILILFTLAIPTAAGCFDSNSAPAAPLTLVSPGRQHQTKTARHIPKNKLSATSVVEFASVNGVVVVPDSLFTEPFLSVRNCFGSKIYDEAFYFFAIQDPLVEPIPSDPACSGAGIMAFQATNGAITIYKPLNYRDKLSPPDPNFQFVVTVVDEPNYAISYEAEPRILLIIHTP